MRLLTIMLLTSSLLGGCAAHHEVASTFLDIDQGRLPKSDITLHIPNLGPCTDNPDRSLHLNSGQPLNILVHGCFGSSGQFRGLAQVMAFQGQQTACFTYDDRARLTLSATQLREAVDKLAAQTDIPKVTVIGHSQGALIARKSLTNLATASTPHRQIELNLVTISGPFSGIESARTCGRTWLYPLTLGLLPASCYLVTGAKWADITYSSLYILQPGDLVPQVARYLKIDTDERGSCRRERNGHCVESDDIFSPSEQHNTMLENDVRALRVEVRAGHVEIVGDQHVAPTKLIAILQQQGVISATAPDHLSAFDLMLARVYQDNVLLNNFATKAYAQP